MRTVLAELGQLDPTLPEEWEPLLTRLVEFSSVFEAAGKPGEGDADAASRLAVLHDELTGMAERLHEPDAELDDATGARIFATALELVTRLEMSTLFEQTKLDTYGSRTLDWYHVDWRGDDADRARIAEWCQTELGVSVETLERIRADLDERLADARRKARVVETLREEFQLYADAETLRSNIRRLTWFLYPDCHLEAEEIELIVVGTAVFLCIPFEKDELDTGRFKKLSLQEQQPIRSFLRRVNDFRPNQFMNFPVFGFLDGRELDGEYIEELANKAGLDESTMRDEISRLVAILPMKDVDKFLVHDVWGHVWQAAMLDFEHMYQELGRYSERLTLSEDVRSFLGEGLTFGDCLNRGPDGVTLDRDSFRLFVAGELLERIPVSFSAAVAELFADVVEFKFVQTNPDRAHEMPSSSHFKAQPAKLDLLINDIHLYFTSATRVFTDAIGEGRARDGLEDELAERGLSESERERVLAAMTEVWQELAEESLADHIVVGRDDNGVVQGNLYGRLCLNFLSLHRAVCLVVKELESLPVEGTPFRGWLELMLLAVSVFFEEDRAQHLWRMDEYLIEDFLPRVRAFAAALAES